MSVYRQCIVMYAEFRMSPELRLPHPWPCDNMLFFALIHPAFLTHFALGCSCCDVAPGIPRMC
jgi:hypothetical protein